ncbi:MAG: hypothetical protein JWO91_1162 [Acidobacteriaceae bacterium]|nr:hypothetical protein [Acidobacteriaceae bacterium]
MAPATLPDGSVWRVKRGREFLSTGKVVDIQQKTHTRVLYYQVDTPVTQDDPYYEISVQIKKVVYVGEYAPRHAVDTLPEEWKAGADIKVRLEKHYMFLERPEGRELQLQLVKHVPAKAQSAAPDSSLPTK